jgi:hypothetical protein
MKTLQHLISGISDCFNYFFNLQGISFFSWWVLIVSIGLVIFILDNEFLTYILFGLILLPLATMSVGAIFGRKTKNK